MKRAAIIVLVFAALGFLAGLLVASVTTKVVPTMKEQRAARPTREVSVDWRVDKYSPGHSLHIINLQLKCDDCHDPARVDFKEVDIGVCTACHVEQTSHPHLDHEGEITNCLTCHAFKFNAEPDSPWDCARCHGPFNTPTHSGLAMHDTIACANCHHPHLPTEETVGECGDCHEALRVQHGRPELSGTCADCHGGHKLASEAAACMECHNEPPSRVPSTAVFGSAADGHSACVDCHEPHAFSASSATRCESCHKRTPVFARRTAREHRDCSSCHDPHAVRAAGDGACMGCHEEVASTHPVEKNKPDCISCHDPHPRRATQLALRCSHCHEEARSERAFHAPKTVCTDCHAPHDFDLSNIPERALCAECHATQVRQTSRIADHSSCESCHAGTAHELELPVACASCHEEILTASPEGHRECASCHEPHIATVNAATNCNDCHATRKLPGLHRIPDDPQGPGHSDCAACHNVHQSTVRADRESCMECHTDIADHQPDAELCTGCHTFISGKPRQR
ncbi:MAG: hypothetical protein WBM96_18125 [Polyangiales bacterium]